jgi:hypothetical protein
VEVVWGCTSPKKLKQPENLEHGQLYNIDEVISNNLPLFFFSKKTQKGQKLDNPTTFL